SRPSPNTGLLLRIYPKLRSVTALSLSTLEIDPPPNLDITRADITSLRRYMAMTATAKTAAPFKQSLALKVLTLKNARIRINGKAMYDAAEKVVTSASKYIIRL